MIALAHQADDLQRAAVLARLRSAGRRGVPYFELRDLLGGTGAERVLDELRSIGFSIQRTPSDHGVLAVLLDEMRAAHPERAEQINTSPRDQRA